MGGNSIHKIRQKVRKNVFFSNYKWAWSFLARGWLRQSYLLSRQKILLLWSEFGGIDIIRGF